MNPHDGTIFLVFLISTPLLIMLQLYMLGLKLSEPEKMLKPLVEGLSQENQDRILKYRDWLASVNLQYLTSFRFGGVQGVVFHDAAAARYFLFYFHKRITHSAESYLEDLTVLDTGAGRNIGLMPRPGAYAQSFPGATPEEVWQRHLEGEAQLTAKFGYQWKPIDHTYEDILISAIRLRMKYVRSQSLWPMRVLWRFAFTRHRLVNKTITQQFP